MPTLTPKKPVYAILLFSLGILFATGLTAILTWASLEADFYGFQRYASDERLGGLTCPPIMTPHETALISVKVDNPAKKEITPIVRIDTSTAGVADTKQKQFRIQPGATSELTQTVSAENIDLGFFIFAKGFRYPAYPLASAEGTCGIMVLDLPILSGSQIFGLWLALSLVLTPLGLWRWNASFAAGEPHRAENAARALAVVAMVGLLVSISGLWLIGILFLALTLLLAVSILRQVTANL